MSQTPISIHIPQELKHHTIPLSEFLKRHPDYSSLVVGALVFAPARLSSPPAPKLLIVQRAATERSFANLFEIPGGSADPTDPTILHSVAREVFEETGLRLTRFIQQVGDGVKLEFRPGQACLKLTFEIEVQEIDSSFPSGLPKSSGSHEHGDGVKLQSLEDIPLTLDPEEHQAFRWVTEDEVKNAVYFLKAGESGAMKNMADIALLEGSLRLTSEDQKSLLLSAFTMHTALLEKVREATS